MDQFDGRYRMLQQQSAFKMLRRLHENNLENKGLNNLSEAFQNFVTRAKFFSIGRLRRTWSHSAVEFMKYRRLLPMLVSDEHDAGSVFDDFADFALSDPAVAAAGLAIPLTARADAASMGGERGQQDDRKICVRNVSSRATKSQLQSFFNKFGKVHSCHIPMDKSRRETIYAIIPKHPRKWHGTCVITFKSNQSAVKARNALPDELIFYGQQMGVGPYISTGIARRRTGSQQLSPRTLENEPSSSSTKESTPIIQPLSRTSSASSLASTATNCSNLTLSAATPISGLALEELPDHALHALFHFMGPLDRIRYERVCKRWLEASVKSWLDTQYIAFGDDPDLANFFSLDRPLRQLHLNAIFRRCGIHLRSLSLAGANQLLDDRSLGQLLGTLCPNLEELDISGIMASPESLRDLSESLPKLRSIAYRGMIHTNERAFWYFFKAIAAQLRSLDVRGCVRLRGRFFKLFSAEFEELLLDGCELVDDQTIEDLCSRSPCLHKLKLDGCVRLTDESLSLISRHLRDLRIFTLNGDFPHLSSGAMTAHLPLMSSLFSLSMDYNSRVDDTLIKALAEGIPALKTLSLAFAGTDKSISSEGLAHLSKFGALEMLDLSGIAAVNNTVMKAISRGCFNIKRIALRSCSYLSPEAATELQNLKNLEHIDLSGCILISNNCVQTLCDAFKKTDPEQQMISLVIGGTICEPHRLRVPRSSLVVLDYSDNSALGVIFGQHSSEKDERAEEEENDEEFQLLSAHRTFVTDALRTEEEPLQLDDERAVLEWAQREATNLGLMSSDQPSTSK